MEGNAASDNLRDTAIVLLTYRPDADQVNFLGSMACHGYDVFVVADDPAAPAVPPPVAQVFVADGTCVAAGFVDLNPMITRRKRPSTVSAWERALYAFACERRRYRRVWFIEDDVFIPRSDTIARIDARHGEAELLSAEWLMNTTGDASAWGWFGTVPRDVLPLPWGKAMVCAVRLGRPLLDAVAVMLNRHPTLGPGPVGEPRYFFIEYLFHIVALHHGMTIKAAPELAGISFRRDWTLDEVSPDCLYHPVKDLALQAAWRRHFRQE